MRISIQGELVDISHLAQITHRMTLDLRGGNQKNNAFLEINFSNHCYSRGPAEGEVIPADMLVPDGSIHYPRDRIFCPIRYGHSLGLVQMINGLIQNNGKVRKSRHENFFSTNVVTQDGEVVPYYIFISARKAQDPGKPKKLVLYVESAYPYSPHVPSPQGKGESIPLSEMLGKVWEEG